jgi:hypothetical protein
MFVSYVETSALPVKDFKILACARHFGPLRREESLSCHTCCDKGGGGVLVSTVPPNGLFVQSPLATSKGYFGSIPYGAKDDV